MECTLSSGQSSLAGRVKQPMSLRKRGSSQECARACRNPLQGARERGERSDTPNEENCVWVHAEFWASPAELVRKVSFRTCDDATRVLVRNRSPCPSLVVPLNLIFISLTRFYLGPFGRAVRSSWTRKGGSTLALPIS